MPVESAADRAVFTNADEFGTDCTYTPAGGVARHIDVIFDNEQIIVDPASGAPVSAPNPHCTVATDDLTDGGRNGDTFLISGATYKFRDRRPDGTGFSVIELEKA